jgi:iron complex transport system permease protein
VGLFLSLFSIKPLNALLLGENYARSLGLNYKEQGLSSFFYYQVFWGGYNCFCRMMPIGLTLMLLQGGFQTS